MLMPTSYDFYGNVDIVSYDDNHIIAHTDVIGDYGDPLPTATFTIEKIDGVYKITDCERHHNTTDYEY